VFVFTCLALSTCYVHGAIAMALVSLCVLVGEGAGSRSWVPAAKVAALVAATLCAVVAFLPGYLTSSVTWRVMGTAAVVNDKPVHRALVAESERGDPHSAAACRPGKRPGHGKAAGASAMAEAPATSGC
jgi:hypothetical protein